MCLIVDANIVGNFFDPNNPTYKEIFAAVRGGRCCIHYGGQLRREYQRIRKVMLYVLAWIKQDVQRCGPTAQSISWQSR